MKNNQSLAGGTDMFRRSYLFGGIDFEKEY